MRHPLLATIGVVLAITLPTAASAQAPATALTGLVSSAGEATMEGVLVSATKAGRIVAWTITQGQPTPAQIKFFDAMEGGPAEAAISILRPGKSLNFTLIAQSPVMRLQPYFGTSVQFPLDTALAVNPGDVVALTVPTWTPALALGFALAAAMLPLLAHLRVTPDPADPWRLGPVHTLLLAAAAGGCAAISLLLFPRRSGTPSPVAGRSPLGRSLALAAILVAAAAYGD